MYFYPKLNIKNDIQTNMYLLNKNIQSVNKK